MPKIYYALVKQFPLTQSRDDQDLAAAAAVIIQLLKHDLDEGGEEYVSAFTDLVAFVAV